jgi:hypothetical protein
LAREVTLMDIPFMDGGPANPSGWRSGTGAKLLATNQRARKNW